MSGHYIYVSFDNWSDRASFGDMFGAVNVVFSGFAFFGVIYAILIQKKELQLQREELGLMRAEAKRTADTLEESTQAGNNNTRIMALNAQAVALGHNLESMRIKKAKFEEKTRGSEDVKKYKSLVGKINVHEAKLAYIYKELCNL